MIQLTSVLGLSAAAGDRSAAGWVADGEEAAAQTHTEASGFTARAQKNWEKQTQLQTKGNVSIFLIVLFIFLNFVNCIVKLVWNQNLDKATVVSDFCEVGCAQMLSTAAYLMLS